MQGKGAEAAEAYGQAIEVRWLLLPVILCTQVGPADNTPQGHPCVLCYICVGLSAICVLLSTTCVVPLQGPVMPVLYPDCMPFCLRIQIADFPVVSGAAQTHQCLVQASRGLHGSTYTKALASLKTVTPDQLAEMQQAASFLARAASGVLRWHPVISADCTVNMRLVAKLPAWYSCIILLTCI